MIADTGIDLGHQPSQHSTSLMKWAKDDSLLSYDPFTFLREQVRSSPQLRKSLRHGSFALTVLVDNLTTGPCLDEEATTPEQLLETETADIADMVTKVRQVFGLNNVQVAKILGISRPSLYNHLSGKESPQAMESYRSFYSVAIAIENDDSISPNIANYSRSVLVDGKTLLGHLQSSNGESETIVEVARKVSEKIQSAVPDAGTSTADKRQVMRGLTRAG